MAATHEHEHQRRTDHNHSVERIEQDHRALRDQLDAVATATTHTALLQFLLPLPEMLHEHFTLEEKFDGFYDDLERRCPPMASELDALRDEHRVILDEFEALCRQLKERTDAEQAAEKIDRDMMRKVARALERLRRHERKESIMIGDAYYTDEGGVG